MANFEKAFEKMIKHEGGYANDPQDPGGETYKGIARQRNSKWGGWIFIDMKKTQPNFPKNLETDKVLQDNIQRFYLVNYWDKIQGDEIYSQDIAESIFDFGVNTGVRTASKLAQMACGAKPDGVIGGKTIKLINEKDSENFLSVFALAKISRYIHICKKRPTSRKYFFGWVNRTLEGL